MVEKILELPMNYSTFDNSHSPFGSSWGILGDPEFPGIRMLALHYNRATRAVWNPFIRMPGKVRHFEGRFEGIRAETESAEGELCFYDTDAFLFFCRSEKAVEFFCEPDVVTTEYWTAKKERDILIFQGYSRNGDGRDPDRQVPFLNGMRALKGNLQQEGGRCLVEPDRQGEIAVAVAAMALEISEETILERLKNAPGNGEQARERLAKWVRDCTGEKLKAPGDGRGRQIFLRAVSSLLFNLTIAPGYLGGHVSAFPNRGGYPTHFLWDSAFQNLAYEQMNPAIAKDSILQLAENIRPDGKIPQFVCSTWVRPMDSQPALTGWMAMRYFEEADREDREFMETVFRALEKNNAWWLSQRMTRFGLLSCGDGLETGQDDSPRFDRGAILALDMNSYLVNQMRCTARLGRRLGEEEKAKNWDTRADELAALMVRYLYDPEQNLFFDADADTGERQSLVTPVAFLPLWCGVPLEEERCRRMITDWLLDPEKFFGEIPFPSVAYDQPCYNPHQWWRGPVWMPEAWLILETLKKYGFDAARLEAMRRLYDVMIEDGQLHELFDSRTGEGMGNAQQGWTAAVFLRMQQELG